MLTDEIMTESNRIEYKHELTASLEREVAGVDASAKTSVKTSVKILELLAETPEMTLAEMALIIGKTVRAIEMASSKLIKEGKLRHIGPKKGGHWEVVDSENP